MKFLAVLLFAPVIGQAATVFDGYEAYYATLPNRLFEGQGIELQPYSVEGDDRVRFGWQGSVNGRQKKIEVRNGVLKVNGRTLNRQRVKAFPDEIASESDLGIGTTAYFSAGWTCVENTPTSASGSAVRHKAVYLIKQTGRTQQAWKLPSLFASCTAIRFQYNLVTFDKVTYRYSDGQDEAQGIEFTEYRIKGNKFIATPNKRSVSFVDPGNVYKFSIKQD